jgi:hypothetical protein
LRRQESAFVKREHNQKKLNGIMSPFIPYWHVHTSLYQDKTGMINRFTYSSSPGCKSNTRDTLAEFWRDSSLVFVESRRACHSRACYKPHSHPTFSIGAVDAGASLFTGAADGACSLRPGMMVFIPAQRCALL